MEQDTPPLSEIKTGYTPTSTSSSGDITLDFSHYENLDTPTPIESTDLIDYIEVDSNAYSSTVLTNLTAALDTQSIAQRPVGLDIPQASSHLMEHELNPPIVARGAECYHSQTPSHFSFARALCSRKIEYVNSELTAPYYSQCSLSLSSIEVSNTIAQPVSQVDTPFLPSNIPTSTPIYTPLQPMRLGKHASFDQPSYSCEQFDIAVNRRSVSVPQTLGCCDASSFNNSSCVHVSSAATGQTTEPIYSSIRHKHFGSPEEIRSFSCSSLTIHPQRSLPTPSASTSLKEKQFVCNVESCEKRFARVDELKRHQRIHSDIRPYICNICDKGFTRSDHLITHRRTHTKEKPYPCQYCERCFARSDERSRHVKTHTNPRPNTCMRRRRSGNKNQSRKALTPQQSGHSCELQNQMAIQQIELSGNSSDTSHSQSESYSTYQPPLLPHKTN